jgi:hypothetical protein
MTTLLARATSGPTLGRPVAAVLAQRFVHHGTDEVPGLVGDPLPVAALLAVDHPLDPPPLGPSYSASTSLSSRLWASERNSSACVASRANAGASDSTARPMRLIEVR